MANEKNKWIDAVGKLLEFTQEGSLSWKSAKPPAYLNNDTRSSRVDVVYEAHYKDRTLRLYEATYKVDKPYFSYSANAVTISNSVASFFDQREYPYWTTTTVLELLDNNELSPWAFPKTQILHDLLDAVRYQVSDVKDFLNELLAEAS